MKQKKMKRLCPGDKVRLRRAWNGTPKGTEGIISEACLFSGYSVLGIGAWLGKDDLELVKQADKSTISEARRMEQQEDDDNHEAYNK